MLILQCLSTLLPLLVLYCIIKTGREHQKYVKSSQGHLQRITALNENLCSDLTKTVQMVAQLYALLDIVVEGIHPYMRLLYYEYRDLKPDQLPKNKKEEFAMFKDIAMKRFLLGRDMILKSMTDPMADLVEKQKMQEHLTELDGMINILSTIDKNTSDEYINSAMKDIIASIVKLNSLGHNEI